MFVLFIITLIFALASADKVIGGQPAKSGQFPYVVSLQKFRTKSHFCGAAIITKRWLLTAAHCINRRPVDAFVVFGGSIYLNETQEGTYFSVEKKKVHPHFRNLSRLLVHDVGMIKITEDIIFNENLQPIKLPFEIDVKPGDEAIGVGWGDTSFPNGNTPAQLQFLISKIIDNSNCSAIMNFPFGDGHLCFGGDPEFGLCYGDSGSPLVFAVDNVNYVVGLVSWGVPCAVGFPDVFMKVSYYLSWIEDQMFDDS